MKIAYIYSALITVGGADRVITEKANYFAEKLGWDVYIITDSQRNIPPVFPLSPKVHHIDLNIRFDKQYNHSFLIRGWYYLTLRYKYKKNLSSLLKSIKPDFTCSALGHEADFLTHLKDGSKKIGEAHISRYFMRNFHLLEQKGFIYKLLTKYWRRKLDNTVKELDAFVVLTQDDANNWKKIKNAVVIPNSQPFYPEQSSTCTNKEIISVGRLYEQKGYDLLIQAWQIVTQQHPDWTLSIYGNGELQNTLMQQIKDAHIESNFIIKEPVKNIQDKYLESSIYVMSSRFEGFGMVLIEAMACGVPCISFNCPNGPSDIIKDGEDGLLVENGNIQQLAEKICFLIEHDDIRIAMGKKAKINVLRYQPDIIMKKWISLFKSLKDS